MDQLAKHAEGNAQSVWQYFGQLLAQGMEDTTKLEVNDQLVEGTWAELGDQPVTMQATGVGQTPADIETD